MYNSKWWCIFLNSTCITEVVRHSLKIKRKRKKVYKSILLLWEEIFKVIGLSWGLLFLFYPILLRTPPLPSIASTLPCFLAVLVNLRTAARVGYFCQGNKKVCTYMVSFKAKVKGNMVDSVFSQLQPNSINIFRQSLETKIIPATETMPHIRLEISVTTYPWQGFCVFWWTLKLKSRYIQVVTVLNRKTKLGRKDINCYWDMIAEIKEEGTTKEHPIMLTILDWTKGKIILEAYFLDAKWWIFRNGCSSQ